MLHVKSYFFVVVLFSTVKKDMKDEVDDRMQQFKKKAKELRILDSKTAQNLCTCCDFFFFFLIISLLQYFSNKTSSFVFNLKKSELELFDALTHISSFLRGWYVDPPPLVSYNRGAAANCSVWWVKTWIHVTDS